MQIIDFTVLNSQTPLSREPQIDGTGGGSEIVLRLGAPETRLRLSLGQAS
jgi:hypothetical protein